MRWYVKLRRKIFNSLIFILLMTNAPAWALKQEPLLVLDEQLNLRLPRNFRTAKDIIEFSKLADFSTAGMANLNISGSGQFSWKTLNAALTHMNEPVWIVDLRQESHGFLNGRPISWYGDRNAENDGKSLKDIIIDEKARLAVLSQYQVVTVHQILEKQNGIIKSTFPRKIRVLKIETEPMLLARMRVAHVRIPVRDHFRPSNAQVDRFITMMLKKTNDTWIHYHCRAGKGRTTSFMAMHDMIYNAKTVPFEDIIKRQHIIGGADLFGPPKESKQAYAIEAAEERKAFLKQFYQYARDSQNGYPHRNWTSWLALVDEKR